MPGAPVSKLQQQEKVHYDHIVSLGYNCEVSFRIKDHYGDVEPYFFTWVYVRNRKKQCAFLENRHLFMSGDIEYLPGSGGMFLDTATDFAIHSRMKDEELLINGEEQKENMLSAVKEMKERYSHLLDKTFSMFSDGTSALFVVKVAEGNADEICAFLQDLLGLLERLCTRKVFTLLCVTTHAMKEKILHMESANLKVRSVSHFADDAHTDSTGDMDGWDNVFSEFPAAAKECQQGTSQPEPLMETKSFRSLVTHFLSRLGNKFHGK